MPSGVKRPWDLQNGLPYGSDAEGENKRFKETHRDRERRDSLADRNKDRHSFSGRSPKSNRDRDERDRRSHRHERDDDRHRPRRSDYRDDRRDHDRRRDGSRDRRHSRDRHRTREKDRPRDSSRSRRHENGQHHRSKKHEKSKEKAGNDSEKEEGEISSTPSASSRSPTPVPRHRSRTRSPIQSRTDSQITSPPMTETEPTPHHEKETEPDLELELAVTPPPVEDVLAKRRAQRQAILAKYNVVENGVASSDVGTSGGARSSSTALPPPPSVTNLISDMQTPQNKKSTIEAAASVHTEMISLEKDGTRSPSGSPELEPKQSDDFSLAKEAEDKSRVELEAVQEAKGVVDDEQQVSAADYDPNVDRRLEEARRAWAAKKQDTIMDVEFKPPPFNDQADVSEEQESEIEKMEEEVDDDIDDMFAVDSVPKKKVKKTTKAKLTAPALVTMTLDAAADPEGYYQVILGEQLDGGKYQVFSSLGKGMFSNVVRARILSSEIGEVGKEVAIKIVRAQETMYKAGLKEIQILKKLMGTDPDDKRHLIRLERTFEHRGHLCLVFESMSMNLREVIKRFGKDVGLNIRAVRAYAHQIFLALSLLKKANIMHADIKPDNILVNESKSVLKICDLGSASDVSENDITPYLVSRFYRAPEIILGLPYDTAIDTWSVGCTLYELYTGKILFPGRSNNQMLLHMMELKGRFNMKMIKKAQFGSTYFDEMGGFDSFEEDKVTGGISTRKVHISKPARDFRTRLLPASVASKLKEDEVKQLTHFVDLLDRCLVLDHTRRITPKEALMHPFVRG